MRWLPLLIPKPRPFVRPFVVGSGPLVFGLGGPKEFSPLFSVLYEVKQGERVCGSAQVMHVMYS